MDLQQLADYSQTGAAISGMLGLLFLWMHLRHRDPGAAWFALAFLTACVVYSFNLRAPTYTAAAHPSGTALLAVTLVCLGLGLVDFLGAALPHRTRWRWAMVATPAALAAALAITDVSRLVAHTMAALEFTLMALMVWRASSQLAGSSYRLVVLGLLVHPVSLIVVVLSDTPIYNLRYLLLVPICMVGATLFAVTLTYARQRLEHELQARQAAQSELRRLNETLELQVGQRTAELRAVVAGLESFNRSVSHDLRGPLGGIAAGSRLALEGLKQGDAARVERWLATIAAEAERLTALVQDLLRLAKAHEAPLQRHPTDLGACLDAALAQLRLVAPIEASVISHGLPSAHVDGGLMRQVFVNLLSNALKFSQGVPSPRVEIGSERRGGELVVFVRDNGQGFDPAQAALLFQPFSRLHRGAVEGSGVGLSIVRSIVEHHGGRVWAEGAPGQGATFYFSLPG